jgi:hypothetical protein
MFHVIEDRGNCLIAKRYGLDIAEEFPIATSPAAPQISGDYTGFWDGGRWVDRPDLAMKFETRAHARRYLSQNAREM